ncbi:hypothetical protein [Enterobacter sp.]|uniref:phage tail tip fiber protein n=1 Tax=Enterobacter sp. TaxID=42895 RepID=UPI00298154BF|nr:hypothetical protein [Enterobacter sp.]
MGYIKSPALSDKARDVLYALFFRGALQSGDIPSKTGANELREAGLVHTQHTATPFGVEDYFTYLTAEGQNFAIQYLAETNFGNATDKPSMDELREMQKAIADSLDDLTERCVKAWCVPAEDKSPVIFLLDRYTVIGGQYTPEEMIAAAEHIQAIRSEQDISKAAQEVSPFAIKDGEVFINDVFIQSGTIDACNIQIKTDDNGKQYAAAFGINVEGNKKVGFLADRFEVTVNAQDASETALQQAISDAVKDGIRNALKRGGLLYKSR